MLGFLAKIFGGNKSEKDVRVLREQVTLVNQFFNSFQSISDDQLRAKTTEFKARIHEHLTEVDALIAEARTQAENESLEDHEKKNSSNKLMN